MELEQLESVDLFKDTVTSQAVYLNVLFPNKYRYYLALVNSVETPILLDHPFRLYFPQTITVEWAPPEIGNGIYLTLESIPEFSPFWPLTIRLYISQKMYNAIIIAMNNPIGSPSNLVPYPQGNTYGEVEFVLLSTDAGEQIKIDLVNQPPFVPEVPITVETLQWNEVLYYIMGLISPSHSPPSSVTSDWDGGSFNIEVWAGPTLGSRTAIRFSPPSPPPLDALKLEFAYTVDGILGITFIDPRYCFLREWISFPPEWTSAIKDFAGG